MSDGDPAAYLETLERDPSTLGKGVQEVFVKCGKPIESSLREM
ncbi:MAG: hypothetical protein AM324_002195 [Candidatus Thorarchaeota archaeon SMTZ1-83]